MNRLILGFAIEMFMLRRYATMISGSAVLNDVDVQALTRSNGKQIKLGYTPLRSCSCLVCSASAIVLEYPRTQAPHGSESRHRRHA